MAATVEGANTYFTTHLESTSWAALTPTQKAGAIATAQAEVNSLPLRKKLVDNVVTDVIPEATKDAMVYEQALFLATNTRDRQNLQAQGVKSTAVSGGVSESYEKLTFGVPLAPRAKAKALGFFAIGSVGK